jgi:hypothetical protein
MDWPDVRCRALSEVLGLELLGVALVVLGLPLVLLRERLSGAGAVSRGREVEARDSGYLATAPGPC